jgi:hypothetical protein
MGRFDDGIRLARAATCQRSPSTPVASIRVRETDDYMNTTMAISRHFSPTGRILLSKRRHCAVLPPRGDAMTRFLLASALLAFASVASAQSVTIVDEAPEQATDNPADLAEGPDGEFADRLCLRQTGSRIVEARNLRSREGNKECVSRNGRVYTRADIDQTGAVDLADALRRLDPSIR